VSGSSKSSGSGEKTECENVSGGGHSYTTKLMDPVERALHNDPEKSRRVETSVLFANLRSWTTTARYRPS